MSAGPGEGVREFDVALPDGRTLRGYDTGPAEGLPVLWHHGTPNLGWPPRPLFATAAELGLRWVSFDRPGYGGSTAHPGRTIGSVAHDVAALADALELDQFGVMGHSGGGPHALACAATMPERIFAAVSIAGLAPFAAPGLDWFAGMGPTSSASLQAATRGRDSKQGHEAENSDAPIDFDGSDWRVLDGDWGWFGQVAGAAMAGGMVGLIDDDLAYVTPWGVTLEDIASHTLLVHGENDHVVPPAHSRWLAGAIRGSELRLMSDASHISVALQAADSLRWLAAHARPHDGSRGATRPLAPRDLDGMVEP